MRARQRKKNAKRRAVEPLLIPWPLTRTLNQLQSSVPHPPNDPDSFWVRRLDELLMKQVTDRDRPVNETRGDP